MIWMYTALFLFAFLLGLINAPQWTFWLISVLFMVAILYLTFYPVLFERDVDKIKRFLRKSKHAHYQFIYYLFDGDEEEAKKQIQNIRSNHLKNTNMVLLLTKQKNYTEAKAILSTLKDNIYKWYYGAVIALAEGDKENYAHFKSKVKEPTYLFFLDMEELVKEGKSDRATKLLEDKMKELRGLKLLTAVQYEKDLKEKTVKDCF